MRLLYRKTRWNQNASTDGRRRNGAKVATGPVTAESPSLSSSSIR
jgi:hypothetical protein